MGRIDDAVCFFKEEIRQFNIALGGILSEQYRNYLIKKRSFYNLAIKAINDTATKQQNSNVEIQIRLAAIQGGANFGERDIQSPDCFYQYRLIGVMCPEEGEIVVEDLSLKPPKSFVTDVMSVYIEGID